MGNGKFECESQCCASVVGRDPALSRAGLKFISLARAVDSDGSRMHLMALDGSAMPS